MNCELKNFQTTDKSRKWGRINDFTRCKCACAHVLFPYVSFGKESRNSLTLWPSPPSVNVGIFSVDKVWLRLSLSYLRFDIICKPWSHSPVNMADDQWKKSTKWRKVNIIYFCLLVFSLDSNKFDIAFLPRFIL